MPVNRSLASVVARLARGLGPRTVDDRIDDLKVQIGSVESRLLRSAPVGRLRETEFSVFSQFGEDGIIQYLVQQLDVPTRVRRFAELGVGDYTESNTRFLLVHDDWSGLIVDADDAHVRTLHAAPMRWRHSIDAVQAFITRDNAAEILSAAGFDDDFGLLSIDLDGNDYWVWEGLTELSPRIVIVEYNSIFGPSAAVSIPYGPRFERASAHPSHLYWGASLGALEHLARAKGYRFVGGNTAGNNAFFVRDDVAGSLPIADAEHEWMASRFRESRAEDGQLTYVSSLRDRRALIVDMPLVDVVTGERLRVRDLPELP